MNKVIVTTFMMWSMLAAAESKTYVLNSTFNDAIKAEFTTVLGNNGGTISGVLIDKNYRRFALPDVCEPEGGNAELKNVSVVNAKNTYFLFVCAWPVQHLGLGLSGEQYEAFLYSGEGLDVLKKNVILSQAISGYEGSLEEGGHSYVWYLGGGVLGKKITELELGRSSDSLGLAHQIILVRLKDKDYDGIKAYLNSERLVQLNEGFPVSKSNAGIYNDFGYALGMAGSDYLAYKILKSVEGVSPERVVLKLNIADVLWSSDKEESRKYYKEYIESMHRSGKGKLIPENAFERVK